MVLTFGGIAKSTLDKIYKIVVVEERELAQDIWEQMLNVHQAADYSLNLFKLLLFHVVQCPVGKIWK